MEAQPAGLAIGAVCAADRHEAVALLADAFGDNPLNLAVIAAASPRRRRTVNAHGLRALLPAAEQHGLVLGARVHGVLAAVLIAAPPGGFPLPAPPIAARLRAALGQGLRVAGRWREVFEVLRDVHPEAPHWYLGTLGVAPALQGRGVGSALLARWLERVDAEVAAAYLETDRSENVSFYERAGFGACGETEVFGVKLWRLWRAPAPVSPRAQLR